MDWSLLQAVFDPRGRAPLGPEDLFVCLGAGAHQLPLMRAAAGLGLRIVAVDRRADAPGFREAEACVQIGTNRPAAIRRMLGTQLTGGRVVGVATRSFGPAAVSAAALAASLGLPGPSVSSVRRFRNKRALKEMLGLQGVRVPASYGWRTVGERFSLMKAPLPLIARPAIGHGKLGVRVLRRATDLRIFLRHAGEDRGGILLEEFVEGAEVTVLGLVHNGCYIPVSISQKVTSHSPLFAEERHSFPARMPDETRTRIQAAMQRIVRETQLSCGPIVAEFLVGADARPVLVEVSPEVGGEFIADCVAEVGAGVPFFRNLAQIATGCAPVMGGRVPRSVVIRYLMPEDGVLSEVQVPRELREHPSLLFFRELRSPGTALSTDRGNLDRPFVFALCMESCDSVGRLEEEAERLAGLIEVKYEKDTATANGGRRRRLGRTLSAAAVAAVLPG